MRPLLIAVIVTASVCGEVRSQELPIHLLDPDQDYLSAFGGGFHGGVVVGSVDLYSGVQSGMVIEDGRTTELPPLWTMDHASARDRYGDLTVGACMRSGAYEKPFIACVWRGENPVDLNTLVEGGDNLYLHAAYGTDRDGRICGGASGRAFLFEGGIVTDLGALGDRFPAIALAMNDHLEIVGHSAVMLDDGLYTTHAVKWDRDGIHDLHDSSQISGDWSGAVDIDRTGRACGSAGYRIGRGRFQNSAVLFDHGTVINLGVGLSGDSEARGMNDFGEVVGIHLDPDLGPRAMWFTRGRAIDLNEVIDPASGWVLERANDIDEHGRILVTGTYQGVSAGGIIEPDCIGSFTRYGQGCAGSGGVIPELIGVGCPAADRPFGIAVERGFPSAHGVLAVGFGRGEMEVHPGCSIQVLPVSFVWPLKLGSSGEWFVHGELPPNAVLPQLNAQAFLFDPGAAHGFSATEPIEFRLR